MAELAVRIRDMLQVGGAIPTYSQRGAQQLLLYPPLDDRRSRCTLTTTATTRIERTSCCGY